jgi:hypothetical protein
MYNCWSADPSRPRWYPDRPEDHDVVSIFKACFLVTNHELMFWACLRRWQARCEQLNNLSREHHGSL